jgi:hypothetical protein
MAWLILEALVALALAVGIVWWTMRPAARRARRERAPEEKGR